MRLLYLLLAGLLVALQLALWFGDVGLRRKAELETLAQQKTEQLAVLADRNHALRAEVFRLKANDAALEDRARYDLGMIKEDEVFYFVPGPDLSARDTSGRDVTGRNGPGIDPQGAVASSPVLPRSKVP